MPSIRKLVEHLINLFMIILALSMIGETFNIFFDIESNENIMISFIFIITILVLIFYSQINKKNKVAKCIASKLVKNPDKKLTIKDIVIMVIVFNFIPLFIGILSDFF